MKSPTIVAATLSDAALLAQVGRQSFIESHGHSAHEADIRDYTDRKFTTAAFAEELSEERSLFHIIYADGQPAGYSKIIYNSGHPNIALPNVTKLERLYVLEAFLSYRLGAPLLEYNMGLAKGKGQSGMWLFVWTENTRALRFYEKHGFRTVGHFDFPISERHSNPNYQMLLPLD
ncbi:GNAT family N-acetyltransferase [Flaviaesturariibacter amylovorans]|uniref:GNAT family N-acetyltransferase n=1 Tax=Flaviaesturariibacter amylovorans TaxID=1084520 RepID=A0ABP8GIN8_9BACT